MPILAKTLGRALILPGLMALAFGGAAAGAEPMASGHGMPNASYTLRTGVANGKMV